MVSTAVFSEFLCSLLWGCQSFILAGQYDESTNTVEKYVPQSFSVSVSAKTLTTPIVWDGRAIDENLLAREIN